MSPDSALGALAQRVARIEQRVDDLMERVVEKFAVVAEDIRVFGPMVREHDEMRAEMRFVRESVTAILARQGALEKRLDEEREERIRGQAERKQELADAIESRDLEMRKIEAERDRQNRELKNRLLVATVALVGVFISALSAVLVPLLTGGTP